MKLMCNTLVGNELDQRTNKRYVRSCLSIGQSGNNKEVYFLLQTNQNQNGTKYKVTNNVDSVFSRCANEGKSTIRLKEPSVDISIQCEDPVQLKSFLRVLNMVRSGKVNLAVANLSSLVPKKIKAPTKTKVVVTSTCKYPVLEGFPRTTEILLLSGLDRRSFDRQILKLQNLKILNLSGNQLISLPQELGNLPNLQELYVANNQLGKSPVSKWSWMSGHKIVNNLRLLDLSSNKITEVSCQINKLHGLISLFLNDNSIRSLPHGIGNLYKLKFLNIARNSLTFLPGSLKNLKLDELDLSHNPLRTDLNNLFVCSIVSPRLLDLAAQVIVRNRIYYDASIIPSNLVPYLDEANYCLCGQACFGSFFKKFILGTYTIARDTKFSGMRGQEILYECYFCSNKCIRLYSNTLLLNL